jgi:NTE family protein
MAIHSSSAEGTAALQPSSTSQGTEHNPGPMHALVLAGGIALGAYHAGAWAALQKAGAPTPEWIAGTSIGAVTAAIIAGNPPERRAEQLLRFWNAASDDPTSLSFWAAPLGVTGPWRETQGWISAMQTRMLGRPGLFRPRLAAFGQGAAPGLYDLAPLHRRIEEVVDFDRVNSKDAPRLSVVATDLGSGERVVFDTRRGTRIGPEHVIASSALPPDFAPVEVEGRLLGDGGLSANTPLDLILDEPVGRDLICFVLDLFSREGEPPRSLSEAAARAEDLVFAGQTGLILEGRQREQHLRTLIAKLSTRLPPEIREDPQVAPVLAEGRATATTILHLAYRSSPGATGIQKTFDFSRTALAERLEAGERDMQAALQQLATLGEGARPAAGLTLHTIRG